MKLSNYKILLLALMLVIGWGCEKEEDFKEVIPTTASTENTIRKVNANQVPLLQNFISSKMGSLPQKSLGAETMVQSPFGMIPLQDIMEVIDTEGNTNYTFKIIPKQPVPNTFYNLVVNSSADGQDPIYFVVEYKMSAQFADDFFFNRKTMAEFEGTIKKYPLDTFLDQDIAKSSDLPCPCQENSFGDGGFGGGGDPNSDDGNNNGNTGGDNSGGDSSGSGWTEENCTFYLEVQCSDRDLSPRFFGDRGSHCWVVGYFIDCNKQGRVNTQKTTCVANNNGDCPPNSNGNFGVDVVGLISYVGLTQTNGAWLLRSSNQDLAKAMVDHLWDFKDDEVALALAKENIVQIATAYSDEVISKPVAISILEDPLTNESITVRSEVITAEANGEITTEQAEVLIQLMEENSVNRDTMNATRATLAAIKWKNEGKAFDINFYHDFNKYFDRDDNDPIIWLSLLTQVSAAMEGNGWPWYKALWHVVKEPVHLGLDVLGLIPIVGEAADLINGAIYLVEGDLANASLSAAGAIPFAGWGATGAKLVGKIVITAGGAKAVQVIAKNSDEIIALANRLKDKFVIAYENGIAVIKDNAGKILGRGDDASRVAANLADAVNDRQRNVVGQWQDNIGSQSNQRKGNFGEMKTDLDLAEEGYIPLHTRIDNIDAAGHQGIDAVMEKNGQYFIIESKFSSTTTPSLNPANQSTGLPKQMSDDWIRRPGELSNVVGGDLANDILDAGYTRVLATHGPNGNKIYKLVDSAGNIGNVWTP